MAMSKSGSNPRSLIEELDELVERSIDSMTPAQLKKFRRERKKIMQAVKNRDAGSRAPHENVARERQALRA
jgi:hypothetical protein